MKTKHWDMLTYAMALFSVLALVLGFLLNHDAGPSIALAVVVPGLIVAIAGMVICMAKK